MSLDQVCSVNLRIDLTKYYDVLQIETLKRRYGEEIDDFQQEFEKKTVKEQLKKELDELKAKFGDQQELLSYLEKILKDIYTKYTEKLKEKFEVCN